MSRQSGRLLECSLLVACHQRLQHVAPETPRGGDEALVVALEQLPVDARLVVVALEEGQARELDQVAVPDLALGQQGQVVVELLPAFGLATRVIDAAASRRTLEPRLPGHVGLHPDHGLHARVATGLVEVQDPVHVAVVGDAHRRLPIGHRCLDDLCHPRRTVEHRKLGVQVEVDERVPQCRTPSPRTTRCELRLRTATMNCGCELRRCDLHGSRVAQR